VQILFVCTGNTCRSPMAALSARAKIHEHNLSWTVVSAGLFATAGLQMTAAAANALIHRKVPLQPHLSQQISAEIVAQSDIILPMTKSHADELRKRYPEADHKIIEFGQFVHGQSPDAGVHYDIVDPFGGSDEHYDVCATEIESGINNLIRHLTEGDAK
jgi:protein-tyrosine-phosphatase